jgi:hypothetical protein
MKLETKSRHEYPHELQLKPLEDAAVAMLAVSTQASATNEGNHTETVTTVILT